MAELHALIVEDELLIGLGLQSMLADLGFSSFAFAGTARQALEQAQLQCPDLVTLDMRLLDGDGFEASDAIQEACGPLPVVYVTGDAAMASKRPGAVVLEKPVTTAALGAALERARVQAQQPSPSAQTRPVMEM
ncbi:MAG TPA: response regulator [Caulobacteraceae bacterium]|nr:response regulator [Caulobacteraceae bacterium]